MRDALAASGKGGFTEPGKQPSGNHFATWLDGLRLAPSTVASYRKNIRLHVTPYIGVTERASAPASRCRLALRWRDIDLDAATITIRRSAGVVRVKGEGAQVKEGRGGRTNRVFCGVFVPCLPSRPLQGMSP
jgi:hypothetical protein